MDKTARKFFIYKMKRFFIHKKQFFLNLEALRAMANAKVFITY